MQLRTYSIQLASALALLATIALIAGLLPRPGAPAGGEQSGPPQATAVDSAVADEGCPAGQISAEDFLDRERRMRGAMGGPAADLRRAAYRALEEADFAGPDGCVLDKHPEPYGELMLRAQDYAQARLAPTGRVSPGAFGAAVEQRQEMQAQAAAVEGTAGSGQEYGEGPLLMDDERYGTAGLGLVWQMGRVDDFAWVPTHGPSGRLYAAAGTGGIWYSDDLADSWHELTAGMPSTIVGSVGWTRNGGADGTLIAVSGDPTFGGISGYPGYGAFYSTDQGGSWTRVQGIPDGALGFEVAVDPTNPDEVYVATMLGLYRSTDAGRTFRDVRLPVSDECAGAGSENPVPEGCWLANVVTDVMIKEPDGPGFTDPAPAVPAGTVVAAVGWRGGNRETEDGHVQSPANGIYRSETGAPGSFARVDERPPGDLDNPAYFTEQHRIGRVELGAATGDDQDHDYLYAIVQDAEAINGGINALDAPDGGPDEAVPYNTMLEGVYVSPDFGASWTRMNDDQDYQGPETGSALSVTFSAFGYQPGIQAWYNLCVEPDPTRADPATHAPTRMIVCLEEVWQNEDTSETGALNEFKTDSNGKGTAVPMKVIGPYYKGETCQALTFPFPMCPTNRDPAPSTTTHPDQHAAMFVPAGDGGVHLFMGNDGGVYRQSKGAGEELDSTSWGNGNNLGFQTLLPYHGRMARDGTVWFGLQDNGTAKIVPDEGRKQFATFGGDGHFVAVDPDNSDAAYSETPFADMRSTGDGGRSWSGMAPPAEGGPYRFNNPFVMDPTDANHLMTAGSKVYETTQGAGTTTGSWVEVYDLGTSASPGDPDAAPGEGEIDNQMTAIDTVRDAAYVGFCGTCDILNSPVPFQNGLATNVGGDEPRERLSSDGWHIAAAEGLPNRFITSIAIDPNDASTIYVSLGGYSRKWFGPDGALGDDNRNIGAGHVFVSRDAGETFTDLSGNLPDAPATWVTLRGDQLIVGTDVGLFASGTNGADEPSPTYATLPDIPATPITSTQLKPGDPNTLMVSTYGRGIWTYTFEEQLPALTYERVAGLDRIRTATQISREHHDRSDTVVIARGDIYPDALAGAPLAYRQDAPLLLTFPDRLHPETAVEIRRLGARRAILLGGDVALSPQVEADLEALGVGDVTRRAGVDRFDTARLIAEDVPDEHVYIAEGADPDPRRGWPDALSVAPLAAHQQRPVLLVTTESLPDATKQALDELDASEATFVGGVVAISEDVRTEVEKQGVKTKSIAGVDRYDTSAQVATIARSVGMSEDEPWLSTGKNFPDALTAGPTVAAHGGILLLVPQDHLHEGLASHAWLEEHAIRFTHVRFVGGPVAISDHVVEEVKAVVRDGIIPDPPPPPLDGETIGGPFTFETGPEGWTTTTSDPVVTWRVGPPGHDSGQSFNVPTYNNEMNTTLTSPEFQHPGGRVLLDWWQKVNTEEGFDFLTVSWSSDGEVFHSLEGYSGPNEDYPNFTHLQREFVAPEGPLYVRFTLSSDQLVTSEGAYIDDVTIQH